MDVLSIDLTSISGGSLLIVAALLSFAFALYRASPIGQDAVESWKNLAVGRKEELDEARADAALRFSEVEQLKTKMAHLEVELARCQERPSTDELAKAIKSMQEGFEAHRSDLMHTQNRLLAHLETQTEASKSMQQALELVAERLR